MKKIAILTVLLAFSFYPAMPANAGEDGAKVSYSKKKAGGVPFYSDSDEATEDQASAEETNPAEIEPAAGAEIEEDESSDDLSKSMKLPRK